MKEIEVIMLENYGDERGVLYNIPDTDLLFLDKIQNIHFGSINPDSIRGNHYHHQTKEILIITYRDTWTLAWAKKDSDKILKKQFTGSGSILIKIYEGIAHSLKNNGDENLEIIALSSRMYSKENPDTFYKELLHYKSSQK